MEEPLFGNDGNDEEDEKGVRIKFLLIGDKKVGKTTIANHYVNKEIIKEYHETVGTEIHKVKLIIKDKKFILKLVDIPSNNQFSNQLKNEVVNSYYAFIIFDITNNNSFNSINEWINQCRTLGNPDIDIMLIGNKSDLEGERKVTKEEAEKLAKEKNIEYREISALKEKDLQNMFNDAIKSLSGKIVIDIEIERKTTIIGPHKTIKLDIDLNKNNELPPPKKKSCCC